MTERTNVERSAESPAVPAEHGVVIRATPYPPTARGHLTIHGAFNLPRELETVVERPLQRCVVLVVQYNGAYNALTPFREQIMFEDDDELSPNGICGCFHIDLFDEQGGAVPGEYHLFVSMNEFVSNVLAFGVNP